MRFSLSCSLPKDVVWMKEVAALLDYTSDGMCSGWNAESVSSRNQYPRGGLASTVLLRFRVRMFLFIYVIHTTEYHTNYHSIVPTLPGITVQTTVQYSNTG